MSDVMTPSRHDAAVAVFAAAWQHSPDRVVLASVSDWCIVAANPSARDELYQAHGIDLVGLQVPHVTDGADPMMAREKWRHQRDAEITVRPHAFDPERFVRLSMWPLAGFDGEYLVVEARDVDLGFRDDDALELAQPLFDVSPNLVALVGDGEVRYSNARFRAQFGAVGSFDDLIDQRVHADDRAACREAVGRGLRNEPGQVHEVRLRSDQGAYVRAECAISPAPTLTDNGLLVIIVPLGPAAELPESLSPREREIVELLLQGLRVPSIAARLYLSHHTVRNHLRTIFAKCEVRSQRELVERLRPQA
jgi:DNA-binding CsgD family transcriptional regulator